MIYNIRVKEEFTHTYGHGGSVVVPAGARTTSASAHGGFRWVDPSIYNKDSVEHHDALYYGIRVYPDNLTEGDKA
jgi:hypothetical protein